MDGTRTPVVLLRHEGLLFLSMQMIIYTSLPTTVRLFFTLARPETQPPTTQTIRYRSQTTHTTASTVARLAGREKSLVAKAVAVSGMC